MARFVKGDVVVVPFPFSDLTQAKTRQALILSVLKGGELMLCQITSQFIYDDYVIPLKYKDFESGRIKQSSKIRPNRIFTADSKIVFYQVARLKPTKLNEIIEKIIEIIRT